MRELSQLEEIIILKELDLSKPLSMGSSRVVYDYGEYVVKIAIGVGGVNQNLAEINFYKKTKSKNLAEIIAFSDKIVIMEKIETSLNEEEIESIYHSESYINYIEDNKEYYETVDEETFEDIRETLYFLEEYNGNTDDNFQIGFNKNNKVCSYDYGFDTNQFKNGFGHFIGDVEELYGEYEEYIKNLWEI